MLGESYGYIPPPQPSTATEITSEEITSFTEDILQINVYFDTLSEHVIETKATYRVCKVYCILYTLPFSLTFSFQGSSLLSGIGGVLSLFLGISIAMVFEIVELLLDFLGNLLNWIQGKPLGRIYIRF